jgi:hypothetical protein
MVARPGNGDKKLYRSCGSLVAPYITWDCGDESVKCVVVGPGPHALDVQRVTRKMCGARAEVVCSWIPYRNW